ncbi:protein disulfide isomerase [Coprinopsis marcescibilis]|uniref:Protein disulfide isomerase n=1 Tax=Coprinopsis marcescibilis TaxID=230819 RepID=A0A5C3L6D8_COPMA|nr:protein disulfide isomerase [Coprinopsis marcescibilis]
MALISTLITSLAISAFAIPAVYGAELTPENFDLTVAKGHWFIEHYSPYCPHCINFAPTWQTLEKDAEAEFPSVHLAQVNCVLHGDLCDKNGVTGYPQVIMFENGKPVEKFNGAKSLENLKTFISKHAPAKELHHETSDEDDEETAAASSAETPVNPSGEVEILTTKTFFPSLSKGPTFVKFYAPWCGHCKKLAPIWKQLAKHLQGRVQIAEVNCDDESALCKTQNIQGYPTLVYFSGDARSEYAGGRKLEQLQTFAEKASAETLQVLAKPGDLQDHVDEESVVYVLYHAPSDKEIVKIVRQDSAVLLGSPTIYATTSSAIRTKYKIPAQIPWALICLKDHDINTPASILHGTASSTHEELKKWLLTHRLASSLELTQDTFQSVMNAPHGPLVVIAASNKKLSVKIEERMNDVARKWRARNGGSGQLKGQEVIFTWMDAERWKDWMKSMYSIRVDEDEGDLDDVKVIVASHKDLVYYDTDRTGRSLKITATPSLFAALEDIVNGKIGYKNSENIVERLARHLNKKMMAFEAYVIEYPFRFVFFLISGFAVVFWLIYRWVGSDVHSLERGDHLKAKGGRLD